jgi:hypothetical protein
MWMDIGLGGDATETIYHPDVETACNAPKEVLAFLKRHPFARIVVVIDTHCLENGAFVYEGDSPESYQGCLLPEASRPYPLNDTSLIPSQMLDTIPKEVLQYISNAEDTPKHSHKSIIMNLACGATINQPISRHSLLSG